jgi:hypothetical protein
VVGCVLTEARVQALTECEEATGAGAARAAHGGYDWVTPRLAVGGCFKEGERGVARLRQAGSASPGPGAAWPLLDWRRGLVAPSRTARRPGAAHECAAAQRRRGDRGNVVHVRGALAGSDFGAEVVDGGAVGHLVLIGRAAR